MSSRMSQHITTMSFIFQFTFPQSRPAMLQIEPIRSLLKDKWDRYASKLFLMNFLGYLVYLIIFTTVCVYRKEGQVWGKSPRFMLCGSFGNSTFVLRNGYKINCFIVIYNIQIKAFSLCSQKLRNPSLKKEKKLLIFLYDQLQNTEHSVECNIVTMFLSIYHVTLTI